MMRFAVLYGAALWLPGWSFARICGFRKSPTYLIVSLSLAWAVLCLVSSKVFHAGPVTFSILFFSGLSLATTGAVGLRINERRVGTAVMPGPHPDRAIAAVAAALAVVYAAWSGPYLEIPSDAIWHVAEIRQRLARITDGSWTPISGVEIFNKGHGYWYLFFAWACWLSGTELNEALVAGNMVNMGIMAAAITQFTYVVLGKSRLTESSRKLASIMAAVFFFAQFGLHIFAFARYYTFGPVFLNYLVYLSVVALFLSMPEQRAPALLATVLIVLLLVVTTLVHKQETMLALVVMALISGARYFRLNRNHLVAWWTAGSTPVPPGSAQANTQRRQAAVLFAAVLCGYAVMHAYLLLKVDRGDPLYGGRLYSIENVVPFLRNLYILIPTLQLWQAVTAWGVAVYAFYIYKRGLFAGNDFLAAGMILPVVTVLNPVFVDLFLRLSWPEVLWRLCYAIPLYVVGGAAMGYAIERLRRGCATARLKSALAMFALVVTLYPLESTYVAIRESKWLTLKPVAPERDHRHWSDLIAFLDGYAKRTVLTDIITGYTLKAFSAVKVPGYKFVRATGFDVKKKAYAENEFAPYRGGLVVINLRDGADSETGRAGRHWPADVLKVSRAYSDEFIGYVESRPERFTPLWRHDRVSVYEIR